MSANASDLIFHHYDFSNFSEKIRLVFGFKKLNWYSVEIPSHLPKPDYTPLTGGYRRTPALQIGADIFCDTRLIAQELEARFPSPSLFTKTQATLMAAMCETLAPWAEDNLLWPTALYVTGIHAADFPQAFHSDRAQLHRKQTPTIQQVQSAGLKYFSEMRAQLTNIEGLLSHGKRFILGEEFTLADCIVYGAPWLLETIGGRSEVIEELARTRSWMSEVKSVGHGESTSLSPADALEVANSGTPQAQTEAIDLPNKVEVGESVMVSPRDEHSPAHGVLVALTEKRIVIRVSNDRVDHVHVHFPRIGYRVSREKK
ncbi:MAG: glutathione S-transferase family protein [Pseudomonadota bacterium]